MADEQIAKCILFAFVLVGLFVLRLLRYRRKWAKREKADSLTPKEGQ